MTTGQIIFLLEEESMKTLLEGWLPRLFPGWIPKQHFICIAYQGKTDLEKSLPIKLKAWRKPQDRFVIVRDTDSIPCCVTLKSRLQNICAKNGKPKTLIRLVCQALESWYLGDLAALAAAFSNPGIDAPKWRKRFATPDAWPKPADELERLIPTFQKTSGARILAHHLELNNNNSHSLHVFIAGIRKLGAQMGLP